MVERLIEKAVESTAMEVEPRILKAIKFRVRNSESELRHAARTLMTLMKRNHSQAFLFFFYYVLQVRYLALLIIDELLMRSKLFRTLIVDNLDQLLSSTVGMAKNNPLPPPPSAASLLHSKSIEFLEKWNDSFGAHYRRLRLGYNYLKNICNIRYPEAQANAARLLQQRRERERRAAEIRMQKFESFGRDFCSIKDNIRSTIDEIDEGLGIVSSNKDEDMPLAPLDDEKFEGFRNSELLRLRLSSLREGERVRENTENKVIFDAVRESFKVLVNKHLPAVQEWMSLLIRAEVEDTGFRDSALKDLIDIKNLICSTKRKCEEAGFDLSKTEVTEEGGDDDDIWEEGTFAAAYERKAESGPSHSVDESNSAVAEGVQHECPLRSQLLKEAPIRKWGSSLDNWGSSRSGVLANQRGLDIKGHWGRVDEDATIPGERIAELNVEAYEYEEAGGEVQQPCRAPLAKGGVCGRRDKKVCPFHGRIIPRDDEGFPMGTSSSSAAVAVNEKSQRDRGRDKKTIEASKKARIREHNESVLRDLAMASTS
ncbi:hypothetical protein M569_08389, partial [Genlisea aurea]